MGSLLMEKVDILHVPEMIMIQNIITQFFATQFLLCTTTNLVLKYPKMDFL